MKTYTEQQLKEAYFQGGKSANNLMKGLDFVSFEDWVKDIKNEGIEPKKTGTKMNIIVSKNKVYTTYIETICYEQEYSNEDLKQIAINGAKIALVNYAIYFGSVLVQVINISEQVTKDEDIFDILEKQHKQ